MKKISVTIFLISVFAIICFLIPSRGFAEPGMAEYTCYPPFLPETVEPNIMIIVDNSGSMNEQAYYGAYDHTHRYYGYFEAYKKYSYASNVFTRNAAGGWDGNFLNWLTMRRVDIARKVLMGGLATARTGGGDQTNYGETPQQEGRDYTKTYDDTDGVTPFASGTSLSYLVHDGYFKVNLVDYSIRVQKDKNLPDEADNFVDGNIAGVLQKVGDKARWGNMFFNEGTGKGESGGYVAATIGTNVTSLITDLQNTGCDTWTPLAETYYVCMQYFMQEQVQSDLDYPNNVVPCANIGDDPFFVDGEMVECAGAFVILLTDGASTMDYMIPDYLKDYDNDGNDPGAYPDSGTDYLDDIALYARTNDLRSDLPDDQRLYLYPIYAFGNDAKARQLLQDAAKNGGFDDRNGNNLPDLQSEWDRDGDGIPDTYFEATDGAELERALISAVNDILERAASGTAVAMLANSYEGDATVIQAYFRPRAYDGITELSWLGYLQSLWVDRAGNLREDTEKIIDPATGDAVISLNPIADKIITYFTDPATGEVKVKRYSPMDCRVTPPVPAEPPNPDYYFCRDPSTEEIIYPEEIAAVWDAGRGLADKSADDRKIFTFLDDGGAIGTADDFVVDDAPPQDAFDDLGEVIQFHDNSAARIRPYLGVADNSAWAYLGADHDTRTANLISYIRGDDITGLRTRTIEGKVWKLGDIVNSTPVSISSPPENYDMLYRDFSYYIYWQTFKDREAVTYVGANDGMLHAFASWKYENEEIVRPSTAPLTENIGDELWAYIPRSLLPHLKWLADPFYTHVYYVDMWPKITDAKIIEDGTHYNDPDLDDDWGTILLCGLNLGGNHIVADEDPAMLFDPSYFCLDITDPRNPRLLWERTYAGLQLSTSRPAIIKVGEKWFATFGSGPEDCNATSSQTGKVFVVDLKTGEPIPHPDALALGEDWLFQTNESDAFMNSPVSVDIGKIRDKGINYNVDAVFFGEAYQTPTGAWSGKVYKMNIPCVDAGTGLWDPQDGNYIENPLDAAHPWQFNPFLDLQKPVTASVSITVDESKFGYNNLWVYVGTGRFYGTDDKSNTDTQYLAGVMDPFYRQWRICDASSPTHLTIPETRPVPPDCDMINEYYGDYSKNKVLTLADLYLTEDAEIIVKEIDAVTGKEVIVNERVRSMSNDSYTKCGAYDFSTNTCKTSTNVNLADPPGWTWKQLENMVVSKWGWYRTLTASKERIVEKPLVYGNAVMAPSFVPNDDICEYGGDSYLYATHYLTGTAYFIPFLTQSTYSATDPVTGNTVIFSKPSQYLGAGKASRVALHLGRRELKELQQSSEGGSDYGATDLGTAIIQSSDSSLVTVQMGLMNTRSAIVGWRQQ